MLSKGQISIIIKSRGFLGSLLNKLAGPLMKVAVPIATKYFSSMRNYSCCFSDICRKLKKSSERSEIKQKGVKLNKNT